MCLLVFVLFFSFFFFKQKTAYEMRISDWSSDVCSSDLGTSAVGSSGHKALTALAGILNKELKEYRVTVQPTAGAVVTVKGYATGQFDGYYGSDEIGRASCRERGCQYV